MEKPTPRFKAYRLTETPEEDPRRVRRMQLDDLDPGNVVVRVAYSDVNYKDALAATGKGKILRRASCIGGIDFLGHGGLLERSEVYEGRCRAGRRLRPWRLAPRRLLAVRARAGRLAGRPAARHVAVGRDGVRHRRLHRGHRDRAHGGEPPQAGQRARGRKRRHRRRRLRSRCRRFPGSATTWSRSPARKAKPTG